MSEGPNWGWRLSSKELNYINRHLGLLPIVIHRGYSIKYKDTARRFSFSLEAHRHGDRIMVTFSADSGFNDARGMRLQLTMVADLDMKPVTNRIEVLDLPTEPGYSPVVPLSDGIYRAKLLRPKGRRPKESTS